MLLLAQDDFFWKKGVQVGHKSAEGIPSYIFKTKIIPKLSRKEIRWDSTKGEKNRIQTVGSLFRPQNTDNPEKGDVHSVWKKLEIVSFFFNATIENFCIVFFDNLLIGSIVARFAQKWDFYG